MVGLAAQQFRGPHAVVSPPTLTAFAILLLDRIHDAYQ